MSESINVVMIGPKFCGKTSILSVMLHDIQDLITRMTAVNAPFPDQAIRPSLKPVGLSSAVLGATYAKLTNIVAVARKSPNPVDVQDRSVMGYCDVRITPLVFSLGKCETQFNFFDFPGGFYSQAQIDRNVEKGYISWSKEEVEQWEGIVRGADVIVLAIDTTVQIGQVPQLRDRTYYQRITNLVKDSIKKSKTTLIFAPVKCEHIVLQYAYEEECEGIRVDFSRAGCVRLIHEIEKLFPELVSHVRNPDVWANVNAFFIPMITVGGVKCIGVRYDPKVREVVSEFSPALTTHYVRTPFYTRNCDKIFALSLFRMYERIKIRRSTGQILPEVWFRDPLEVFVRELAESIDYKRMCGEYFAANKENLIEYFQNAIRDEELKSVYLGHVSEWANRSAIGVAEDGCWALNPVDMVFG